MAGAEPEKQDWDSDQFTEHLINLEKHNRGRYERAIRRVQQRRKQRSSARITSEYDNSYNIGFAVKGQLKGRAKIAAVVVVTAATAALVVWTVGQLLTLFGKLR